MESEHGAPRLGIFGGTFDPVHTGHLAMAVAAQAALALDKVLFVPAWQNPLKAEGPHASGQERLALLRIATAGAVRMDVWAGELAREAPSYALHTVMALQAQYPHWRLFWILGADQLEGLRRWYQIDALVQNVKFIVLRRPGSPWHWPGIAGLHLYRVENVEQDVEGRRIRAALFAGEMPERLPLAPAVAQYIKARGLYRPPEPIARKVPLRIDSDRPKQKIAPRLYRFNK